jgi:aryl sulfotransferase
MQRIVDLLLFQSAEPRPLDKNSPWVERRIPMSPEELLAAIDAQAPRRALKTHLPLDGLPLYDDVQYIHVGRDGRDAVLSFHNHLIGVKEHILVANDAIGLADETLARPYPRVPADPAEYFHKWLRTGAIAGQTDGYQFLSYFELEKSYWSERKRDNIHFVHYKDLKADLEREMRLLATFLGIQIPEEVWPSLIQAASFNAMREQGAELMPGVVNMFNEGKERFFNKGVDGRWRDIFAPDDLARYVSRLTTTLPLACARWLEGGRRMADPRDPTYDVSH